MQAKMLPNKDVSYLDELLLDEEGLLKVLPHKQIAPIDPEDILIWCNKNAVYVLPTQELINWLRDRIAGRSAIEIGAGHGSIARALGIPATDSYMQIDAFSGLISTRLTAEKEANTGVTDAMIASFMAIMQQMPTEPPKDVEKLDAQAAIEKYNPHVVIGAFITHKFKPGMSEGNARGVEEENIIAVAEYIHIGNAGTHYKKPILDYPYESFKFPWLVTRAFNSADNAIWVWNHV